MTGPFSHLAYWNTWRDFVKKAKDANEDWERNYYSYAAAVWQMEYVCASAEYWQGVRP